MATLNATASYVNNSSTGTVTAQLISLDTNYGDADRSIVYTIGGVSSGSYSIGAKASTAAAYSRSGLVRGARYSVSAVVTFANNGNTASFSNSVTIPGLSYYYLYYNANGGTGAPSNTSAGVDASNYTFTVSSTIPTRPGHSFLGWSLSSAATTATYVGGDTIRVTSSATLYAVWQQITTWTLNYNANGGVNAPETQILTNTTSPVFIITLDIPYRASYQFIGWALIQTGTPTYFPGDQLIPQDSSTTLYAIWEARHEIYYGNDNIWKKAMIYAPIEDNIKWVGNNYYEGASGNWRPIYTLDGKERWTKYEWAQYILGYQEKEASDTESVNRTSTFYAASDYTFNSKTGDYSLIPTTYIARSTTGANNAKGKYYITFSGGSATQTGKVMYYIENATYSSPSLTLTVREYTSDGSKGELIDFVMAPEYTYPDDGIQDNYWYTFVTPTETDIYEKYTLKAYGISPIGEIFTETWTSSTALRMRDTYTITSENLFSVNQTTSIARSTTGANNAVGKYYTILTTTSGTYQSKKLYRVVSASYSSSTLSLQVQEYEMMFKKGELLDIINSYKNTFSQDGRLGNYWYSLIDPI